MIRKRFSITFPLVASAALCLAVPPAIGVEEEKAPAAEEEKVSMPVLKIEELAKIHSHRAGMSTRGSSQLKRGLKLPEAADIICGTFYPALGKDAKICITRSDKKGPWEKMIIDVNGNKDLTDDKVYSFPPKGKKETVVLGENGKKGEFSVSTTQSGSYVNVMLFPVAGWHGAASIGDAKVGWAACDCNLSGQLDAGDSVHLDMNGNGSLADRGWNESLTLGSEAVMYRDGKWSGVTAAADNQVAIGPYQGKMSKLTIDHAGIVDSAATPHDLRAYITRRKQVALKDVNPAEGITLPAKVYLYFNGLIKSDPKVSYTIRGFDLKKDTVLKLEKPVSHLTVSQSKGKLSVSQKIRASQNVSYSMPRAKPGPRVEVFSEKQPDKPVVQGNMSYG